MSVRASAFCRVRRGRSGKLTLFHCIGAAAFGGGVVVGACAWHDHGAAAGIAFAVATAVLGAPLLLLFAFLMFLKDDLVRWLMKRLWSRPSDGPPDRG